MLEIGLRESLCEQDYLNYGVLCKDTWVEHMWKFIYESMIQIYDDLDDFVFTREKDVTLVSSFLLAYTGGLFKSSSGTRQMNAASLYGGFIVVGIVSDDGKYAHGNILKKKTGTEQDQKI